VIFVVTDKIDQSHAAVRTQAYPYDVSHLQGGEGEVQKDLVVEARSLEGMLLGFIVLNNDYIVDVAVAPAAQGMGVGGRLIREAAKARLTRLSAEEELTEAEEEGEAGKNNTKPMIRLHVRYYNLPARALYLRLGFKETARCFPAWYDWHGGVSMEASLEEIVNPRPKARVAVSAELAAAFPSVSTGAKAKLSLSREPGQIVARTSKVQKLRRGAPASGDARSVSIVRATAGRSRP